MASRIWLLKSEPDDFSYADLLAAPAQTTLWDGVRNYQARNRLRDELAPGDGVLFYHSSCPEPGVAGLAEVAGPPTPDPTQFDPTAAHYDPGSPVDAPRWIAVPVRARPGLSRFVSLAELRADPLLSGMELLRPGQRLSVQAVQPAEWEAILALASGPPVGRPSGRRKHP